MKLKIFTDGASRGNPGRASYGFVVLDEQDKLIYEEGKYIGINTNNVAEYTGVLEALRFIKKKYGENSTHVELFADSKLAAEQLSGNYKIRARHLMPLINEIQSLSLELGGVVFSHISRERNKAADRMANLALDR